MRANESENRNYPLPSRDGAPADDIEKVRSALVMIDGDIATTKIDITTTKSDVSALPTTSAVQALINAAITDLVNGSPAALNTLNELAAALGDDANFSTTVTNALAARLQLTGGTLTGPLTLAGDPTQALHAATKQYIDSYALPRSGGTVSGSLRSTYTSIPSSGEWNLNSTNTWSCNLRTLRNPTGIAAGQSGIIVLNSAVNSWGSAFKFPGGAAPSGYGTPAIVPYMAVDSTRIFVGNIAEEIR